MVVDGRRGRDRLGDPVGVVVDSIWEEWKATSRPPTETQIAEAHPRCMEARVGVCVCGLLGQARKLAASGAGAQAVSLHIGWSGGVCCC